MKMDTPRFGREWKIDEHVHRIWLLHRLKIRGTYSSIDFSLIVVHKVIILDPFFSLAPFI